MTHLRIEQNEGAVEYVSSAVIKKLYDLATSGDLDVTSNLQGTLHVTTTYQEYEQALETAYPHLHISADNYYVLFQDLEVLRVLLTNSIGDGVGVTLTQAASANIGSIFKNNTTITSFDELRFFTSTTGFGQSAFEGCSSLTSIKFPSTLISIGANSFRNCSSLTGVLDLSDTSVTTIWQGAFQNTGFTGIICPTTLTKYGHAGNSSPLSGSWVVTFKGLDNVTDFGGAEYGNVSNAIYMGQLVSSGTFPVKAGTDSNRSGSIPQLYMPKFQGDSSGGFANNWGRLYLCLGGYSIRETSCTLSIKLLYFKNIQFVKKFSFYGCRIKNLVINNITPPPLDTTPTWQDIDNVTNASYWKEDVFGTIPTTGADAMTIYVPDSAVATYQADSNYNAYTIRGINEVDPNTNQPYLTRYATNDLWEAAGKPEDALIEEYMN